MRHTIQSLVATLAIVLIATSSSPVADVHGIYGADAEMVEVIEEAIDRYERVGMPLPPMRIYVHPTTDDCRGHSGMFGQYGETDRIDLCDRPLPYLILHELAHAWGHHNVAEGTRNAFLDRTGLVWYDADLLWKHRGIEQLAIAVAWGVWERPLLPSIDYTEQLERFELLTGREAPRLSVRAE